MITEFKNYTEEYSCEYRWGTLHSFSGVTPDGYEEYVDCLKRAGYEPYSQNQIDENLFVTMVKGSEQINVAYYPKVVINNYYYPVLKPDGHHDYDIPHLKDVTEDSVMKVSVTKMGGLPKLSAPEFERLAEPSITQMRQMGIGMSYVLQLADGSFIIIDGGLGVEGSLEYHLDFLESHKPDSHEKPRVAWLFTHAHPDHVITPVKFMEKYGDRIEVTLFAHALIDETCDYATTFVDGGKEWTEALLDTVRKNGAKELIFHTGQTVRLAGCDVQVLNTYEDTYPTPIGTLNSASCILKFVFKDGDVQRSVLIVGDSTETNTAFVNAVYSKATLKSDILQVAHHGVNASPGTQHLREFYASVAPRIALFSSPEKVITQAAFSPNLSLSASKWIYADEENTVTIFE